MLLTKFSIAGISIISSVIIIGLYIFSMNSSLLTLTNPLVVYATTNAASHSEHMSEMNYDSSNSEMPSVVFVITLDGSINPSLLPKNCVNHTLPSESNEIDCGYPPSSSNL